MGNLIWFSLLILFSVTDVGSPGSGPTMNPPMVAGMVTMADVRAGSSENGTNMDDDRSGWDNSTAEDDRSGVDNTNSTDRAGSDMEGGADSTNSTDRAGSDMEGVADSTNSTDRAGSDMEGGADSTNSTDRAGSDMKGGAESTNLTDRAGSDMEGGADSTNSTNRAGSDMVGGTDSTNSTNRAGSDMEGGADSTNSTDRAGSDMEGGADSTNSTDRAGSDMEGGADSTNLTDRAGSDMKGQNATESEDAGDISGRLSIYIPNKYQLPSVNPCFPNPCHYNGVCATAGNSYTCACVYPRHGRNCQLVLSSNTRGLCSNNPCLNGGTCRAVGFSVFCTCRFSFTGRYCGHGSGISVSTPFCRPNTCQNNGVCSMVNGAILCTCPYGYTGDRCGRLVTRINTGGCYNNPCMNNGVCRMINGAPTCTCAYGFSGTFCGSTTVISDTTSGGCSCQNGGVCNGGICTCAFGFSGTYCEIQTGDGCSMNPCANGGICIPQGSSYSCQCVGFFYGAQCEFSENRGVVDWCVQRPCQNGGTCMLRGTGRICSCPSDFSGTDCENKVAPSNVDPCSPNPCLNAGVCRPSAAGSYTCMCVAPYSGDHCEINQGVNPCSPMPCMNGCECKPSCRHSSGYYCSSQSGFLGKNCTIPPPMVDCRPNQVVVTVDDRFVREYDLNMANSRLFITANLDQTIATDCFASVGNGAHTFVIPLPFSKCGTSVGVAGSVTTVRNTIWLNRFTGGRFDMPVPVISFECSYQKEYMIVTSLKPAFDRPPMLHARGINRVNGMIELCKVSTSCPLSCPPRFGVAEGAVYTVGEKIHLNIKGDNTAQEVLALESLHLSCDGNPSSAAVVQLVSGGCPGSTSNYMPTMISHSGMSGSICVTFQVPRLSGCSVFYIHAEVEICGPSGCSYNTAACGTGRRRRRSAIGSRKFGDILGPIYYLNGGFGKGTEFVFPDTSIVAEAAFIDDVTPLRTEIPSNDDNSEFQQTFIVAAVCVLCLVLLLIAAFVYAAVRYRRSYFEMMEK